MSHPNPHQDGKLLFAIAGGILVIAVGIAILAGLGQASDSEPTAQVAMPAVQSDAVQPVAMPASNRTGLGQEIPSLVDLVEDTESHAGPLVVDPSADFVSEGIAAYESNDYTRAAAYFGAEVEARPERAWTHYILALSLWKSGATDEAADEMRRSLELDASQIKALVNLARIENDRGEFDAALNASDAALVSDSENAEAWFLRARSLYNSGDKEAALAALDESLARDPENGYAHNLAGLIWIERGEAGPAVIAMEQAAARIPTVVFVQNNLGMAFELDGRLDAAAAAYARAVSLSPGHERAALNLARLDGRIPETPDETPDPQPVVAALGETNLVSDASEIPD